MKCPQCGFVGSDYVQTCKRCNKDLSEARAALHFSPLDRPRQGALTSLLDGPIEPSLVDDGPPPAAPAEPVLDIDDAPEKDPLDDPLPEEDLPELLAQAAPVDPSEIMTPQAPTAGRIYADSTPLLDLELERLDETPRGNESPAASGSGDNVLDFGEPLELEETRDASTARVPAPAGEEAWDRTSTFPDQARATTIDDEWNQLEGDLRRERDPKALPKGGFWIRLVAQVVDGFFLNVVGTAIFAFVVGATGIQSAILDHLPVPGTDPMLTAQEMTAALQPYGGLLALTFLLILSIDSLYRPICHWRWGKTIGKKLLGLRLVGTDGERISLVRAFARDLALLLSFLPLGLGFLWVAWDSQKQAWHDKLAGTYVLKEMA
ncbi:MAG: hypothetical protein A2Y95_07915 [Deltaproteobacteria bacterium RBG_13_65_10]|nr:MAG: hypothetical protein A2Y95_07915 [Deltaproteobacteria bacterium RBG_13_65_10]